MLPFDVVMRQAPVEVGCGASQRSIQEDEDSVAYAEGRQRSESPLKRNSGGSQ